MALRHRATASEPPPAAEALLTAPATAPNGEASSYSSHRSERWFTPVAAAQYSRCFLTFTAFLSLLGLAVFSYGFFLTRIELRSYSHCHELPYTLLPLNASQRDAWDWLRGTVANSSPLHMSGACWMPRTHRRFILLIVDALRFDFAVPIASLPPGTRLHPNVHGHMPSIGRALTRCNASDVCLAALYRARADAPTVTLQRIKGMMSGNVPTFIDVSSNFAQAAVGEDTLLHVLREGGHSVLFAGDDTWMGMFPAAGAFFSRAYPYPSLNVRDLDTVDAGVAAQLPRAMRGEDGEWKGIIGHTLGVDHVGHRYHSEHVEMARKLGEMDALIDGIMREMGDDTLLIVMGDHGMTRGGDHGGATREETDVALFMFAHSGGGVTQPPMPPFLHQVDMLPALSLMLGLPIPFVNLGVLPSNLPLARTSGREAAACARALGMSLNAAQMHAYMRSYGLQHPMRTWDAAVEALRSAYSTNDSSMQACDTIHDAFRGYAVEVGELCRRVWTRFDVVAQVIGVALLAACCALHVAAALRVACMSSVERLPEVVNVPLWMHTVVAALGSSVAWYAGKLVLAAASMDAAWMTWLSPASVVGCAGLSGAALVLRSMTRGMPTPIGSAGYITVATFTVCVLCIIARVWVCFTDTLIRMEPRVVLCIVCVAALAAGVHAVAQVQTRAHQVSVAVWAVLLCACAIASEARVGGLAQMYPPFQVAAAGSSIEEGANDSMYIDAGAWVIEASWDACTWIHTWLPLFLTPLLTLVLVNDGGGEEKGRAAMSRGVQRCLADAFQTPLQTAVIVLLSPACVALYWLTQAAGMHATHEYAFLWRLVLPRCVYVACVAVVAGIVLAPGSMTRRHEMRRTSKSATSVPAVMHLGAGESVMAAGLPVGSMQQRARLAAVSAPMLMMLLGPYSPCIIACVYAQHACIVRLARLMSAVPAQTSLHVLTTPLSLQVLMSMCAMHAFYALGHNHTFSSLHFSAAFVGMDAFSPMISGALMIITTFGTSMLMYSNTHADVVETLCGQDAGKGCAEDLVTHAVGRIPCDHDRGRTPPATREAIIIHLLAPALPLAMCLCSCAFACFARRHLMVWAIFAPKVLFEASLYVVAAGTRLVCSWGAGRV